MSIPIRNIFLTELDFVRTPYVPENINYSYTINVGATINDENIGRVIVKIDILEKEKKSLRIKCCMVGLFDLTNIKDLPVSLDDFLYVNAPAIIFPYLRETISSMTLRAGIKPLIIPTFNFKEMRDKKKQEDKKNMSEQAKTPEKV